MNVIIPMAGMGKRMRPHTLNTPKPLLMIAGKSIVQRIVEDLKDSTGEKIDEIHFVIGNFGKAVEENLKNIASEIGAKGFIHYQHEALGTAHAVYCAKEGLAGPVFVAFADTLFIGRFSIDEKDEAIIWTMPVDNPESYGVVVNDENGIIKTFAEKPKEFVSDKAIIGIYYFRDGEKLRDELKQLIDNKYVVSGEYQLTDALQALMERNVTFKCKTIDKWLDCGNKDQFLSSAEVLLTHRIASFTGKLDDVEIIEPVYIGRGCKLADSKIGPNVIIEDNVEIINSRLASTIIGSETKVLESDLSNSLVGNFCDIKSVSGVLNVGDYNEIKAK